MVVFALLVYLYPRLKREEQHYPMETRVPVRAFN
jgi:hypothetical protein